MYNWKWYLSDLPSVQKNGLKVFSCFSCGGGSSMGYKLAGYEVIGNCEIDQAMNKLYLANNHPKHNYLMDVRDFWAIENDKLPEELLHLDILDGSPPCSTFSVSGKREEGWGVEKQFREGQKMQRLDDLFFWYIRIAEKLQPKVVMAENVKGLVIASAKGYVNEIFKAFREAGYEPQLFLLNAAFMGVPQRRERVFFIARRNDMQYPKLELNFSEQPILFGKVRSQQSGAPATERMAKMLNNLKGNEVDLGEAHRRLYGKRGCFNSSGIRDDKVACTITSGGCFYRLCDNTAFTKQDFVNVQSFPQDYDFIDQNPQYVCGMSVPPVMMAQIAHQIEIQWLRPGDCDGSN